MNEEKHIIQYLRNKDRKPYGTLIGIATEDDKKFTLGWSLCNPKDHFNKKMGLQIRKYTLLINSKSDFS